jgi:hypothetical protein
MLSTLGATSTNDYHALEVAARKKTFTGQDSWYSSGSIASQLPVGGQSKTGSMMGLLPCQLLYIILLFLVSRESQESYFLSGPGLSIQAIYDGVGEFATSSRHWKDRLGNLQKTTKFPGE